MSEPFTMILHQAGGNISQWSVRTLMKAENHNHISKLLKQIEKYSSTDQHHSALMQVRFTRPQRLQQLFYLRFFIYAPKVFPINRSVLFRLILMQLLHKDVCQTESSRMRLCCNFLPHSEAARHALRIMTNQSVKLPPCFIIAMRLTGRR